MSPRLWVDVEDLFEYVRTNYRRPTGIQRLAFEVYRELQARYGNTGQVYFVQHSVTGNGFQVVTWQEIAALFTGLVSDAPPPARRVTAEPAFVHLPARQIVRRLAYRLSPSLRTNIAEALMTQGRALRSWGRVASGLVGEVARVPRRLAQHLRKPSASDPSVAATARVSFAELAAPGDVMLMLGATWSHPDYGGLIRRQCKANGLRFALLIYDLIPVRRPEWSDRVVVRAFRRWIESALPVCDTVFAISRATAADVEAYAREQGIALPGPVVTLPLGSELRQSPGTRSPRLPPPGSYALSVSTIEARKNHLLLFRVWRRLLDEMPREHVPPLVFAGRVGWLVADLMQQIANTDNLGGKLILIESPSDAELAALYDGCLFTLFPSFFEGWGLPVTESLGFGKPCLIANRTSLPEAGGDLVRSFDPDNLHDAYAVIRNAIEDRAGLAAWEARIRREFRPVPWSATVDALLAGLGDPLAPVPATVAAPIGGSNAEIVQEIG
ncbi:MAG TPA: glycosyltransferase family 1 protein [Acetobacteraceae bacterium]|nr:glycosyltransferase family 1 protein [Acetobacteraceae bacterium]